MNFDAVVIGAGAVGCSTAFHMAEAGLKVALLDRGFPGSGTSRATQAGVGVYPKKPRANLLLNMMGGQLYQGLVDRLERDVELRWHGVLELAMSEEGMAKIRAFVAKQSEVPGYRAEVLTREEVLEREPNVTPEVVGGAYSPMDGQINPMLYTDALARALGRLGGVVMAGAEVLDVKAKGEHRWTVKTLDGELQSEWVANTAGVYAPAIGRMVGINIPIVPDRGHVLVTEAIPPLLSTRLSGPILIRQTVSGNMLLGRSAEQVGFNRHESLGVLANEAKTAYRIVPALKRVKTIRCFVGLRPWPPDGLPIVGEIPGRPGFLTAVGHSGVTWSPAAGTLLTQIATGRETSLPMEPYSITRFPNWEVPVSA